MCQECVEVLGVDECDCGKFIVNVHCKTTEELLKSSTMQFKCANVGRGCEEFLSEGAMIIHQEECAYRRVECPYGRCECQVSFIDLTDHMKKKRDDHNLQAKLSMEKGKKLMAFGSDF